MKTGRKTALEEYKIMDRWAHLSEPVFKFIIKCLNGEDIKLKQWAVEQSVKGLVKMIPTDLTSNGDSIIIRVDSDISKKNVITPESENNSEG